MSDIYFIADENKQNFISTQKAGSAYYLYYNDLADVFTNIINALTAFFTPVKVGTKISCKELPNPLNPTDEGVYPDFYIYHLNLKTGLERKALLPKISHRFAGTITEEIPEGEYCISTTTLRTQGCVNISSRIGLKSKRIVDILSWI